MKKNSFAGKFMLYLAIFIIVFPLLILSVWSFVERWSYPDLLPSRYCLRGIHEICSSASCPGLVLMRSALLALIAGVLSSVVGTMTARALVVYEFRFKDFIAYLTVLPILVPSAAFAMGLHFVFIYLGLSDTVAGVILVHTMCAMPYAIKIMTDVLSCVGIRLEEQAQVLGASKRKAFFMITLPAILPGVVSAVSLGYIISLSQYFLTLIIGGGKVVTFAMLMVPYIQSGDRTLSGTYSVLLIVSTLTVFACADYAANKLLKHKSSLLFY